MTGHSYGTVLFRGKSIQAVYIAMAVPPEEGCVGCGNPIPPGPYFYIHENGEAWHVKCHWTEPTLQPKRAKPKPVPVIKKQPLRTFFPTK